jgi:hypothetical protein
MQWKYPSCCLVTLSDDELQDHVWFLHFFPYYKYIFQDVDNAVFPHNSQFISEFEKEFV